MPPAPLPAEATAPEPVASSEDAAEEWDALALASRNPFATREWAEAWWARYGGGRELALHRVRDDDGRTVALLPLYHADRGPLRLLRFVGHGPADRLGPVCGPADAVRAAAALRELATAVPRGVLLAERLGGDDPAAAALGGAVVRRESSPALAIHGTWDEWLAGQSANFRQQARRFERRLASAHRLGFRLTEDPARLDADLGTLFELHDARWDAAGGSVAFSPERRAFHRDFAHRALRRGWLRLWIAEVDGRPGAAWYGLRYAGADWYYQLGRDPAWDRYRLGFVLLVHTIRSAFEDGMATYQFGLGDEAYKERFADHDAGLVTVVAGRRAPTAAATGAVALARRMPGRVRRAAVGDA